MIQRFEKLVTGITRIYKSIQKIKKNQMNILGLKGTHVIRKVSPQPGCLSSAMKTRQEFPAYWRIWSKKG